MKKQSFCELNQNLRKRQDNPFSSPLAQYANLLQDCSRYSSLISQVTALISPLSSVPFLLKLFIDLHYSSGCRVSELLQLHSSNITPAGGVFVKGLKNSGNRYIYSSHFRLELIQMRKLNKILFSEYSRFFIYRFYKQNGLFLKFDNSNNSAVTHVFRHLSAVTDCESSENIAALKAYFNHKSIISTTHYVHKNKS